MDFEDSNEANLAPVLTRSWPALWDSVLCFGDILELRFLWMAPGWAGDSIWASVVATVRKRVRHALFVGWACPLEYPGARNPALELGFQHRQRAMQRHYRKLLDVEPFPGRYGQDGWVYQIPPSMISSVEPPRWLAPPWSGAAISAPSGHPASRARWRCLGLL
jgi:hypothetical protein